MAYDQFSCGGALFQAEAKEHILRLAVPGSRNYVIRGILSYGETVELPEELDGDPVTSFMPKGTVSYPGVKRLILPSRLGKLPERNDLFPDLEEIVIRPGNRIFSTDGRMLYREEGRELWLSMAAGMSEEPAEVPETVRSLGDQAFAGTVCRDIIFRNPDIRVTRHSFDGSRYLAGQEGPVYVGGMLYRVKPGPGAVRIREGTERFHESAFSACAGACPELILPRDMKALEEGVFREVDRVSVCEGSAPGLVGALFPLSRKREGGKRIRITGRDGKRKGELLLFPSLTRAGRERLEEAWKAPSFDFAVYDGLWEEIRDGQDQLDYLIHEAGSGRDLTGTACPALLMERGSEVLTRALETCSEEALTRLIRSGRFTREALSRFLLLLQRQGMTAAAACVLRELSGMRKSGGGRPGYE